jgi:hypothetical protein
MKTRLNLLILLPCLILTIASCNSAGKSVTSEGIDSISLGDIKPLIHDTLNDGLPIFYNMYLSVDMSTLFQSSGAVFKQELLNSPDKATDYITSSKKALNLGIYAVDLTYAKVSEQLETAGLYFNAMQKLAEELGIPADYFRNAAGRFDRNIDNKDSLMKIANEIYMASDDYLRDNERYAASAQMIMGGWIEAIHIASDIAVSTKDIDIIERLAEQRISLGNVIGMLEDYAGDVVIMQNLQKLKLLQSLFDTFVVHVDSGFNPASPEGKKIIQEYVARINQISRQVNQIRAEIVS